MYSETDLQSAVAAGALTPQAADALRAHVADLRQSPMADEEQFRLITGFNDIFVSIAAILFLTGCAWVGGSVTPWLGAALVTASAWGMAEFFTARRRMALPSILLLIAFVIGSFATVITLLVPAGHIEGTNRTSGSGQVIGPDERIAPYDGLRAVTAMAAYQLKEEKMKGTLEPGKLADLVILDRNPLKVEATAIKDIVVVETIKEGRTVFAR